MLEKTLESPLDCKEIKSVNLKWNQSWIFIGRIDPEAELQYFTHLMWRADSLEKTLMLGKFDSRRKRKQQRMRWVAWHHQLNGHEFEQTLGDDERTGKPGVLESIGSQRVGHDLVTEQQCCIRANSGPVWMDSSLIISTKTLFPNKITFWDSGWTWLGGCYSTQSRRVQRFSQRGKCFLKLFSYSLFGNTAKALELTLQMQWRSRKQPTEQLDVDINRLQFPQCQNDIIFYLHSGLNIW